VKKFLSLVYGLAAYLLFLGNLSTQSGSWATSVSQSRLTVRPPVPGFSVMPDRPLGLLSLLRAPNTAEWRAMAFQEAN